MQMFLIAVFVEAFEDLWFVGDHFLRETFPTLKTMTEETIKNKKTPPYIEEEFNVCSLYTDVFNQTKSTAARIYNCVVEEMNTRHRLPKYIVVVPDRDVITNGDDFGKDAPVLLYTLLRFLVKNINKVVDARFESIFKKKPLCTAILPKCHYAWCATFGIYRQQQLACPRI